MCSRWASRPRVQVSERASQNSQRHRTAARGPPHRRDAFSARLSLHASRPGSIPSRRSRSTLRSCGFTVAPTRSGLLAQVARSSAQHEIGLSGRPALDRDSGMLFEFDGPRSTDDGFWMWGTSVPLDIAFIDAAGVIVRVLEMDPCVPPQPEESCPGYFSDVAYASALEVNGGWFARHGVAEGARVAIGARGTPGSARPVGAERLSRLIRAWPAGRGGPTTAHHGQCSARVSAPGNQNRVLAPVRNGVARAERNIVGCPAERRAAAERHAGADRALEECHVGGRTRSHPNCRSHRPLMSMKSNDPVVPRKRRPFHGPAFARNVMRSVAVPTAVRVPASRTVIPKPASTRISTPGIIVRGAKIPAPPTFLHQVVGHADVLPCGWVGKLESPSRPPPPPRRCRCLSSRSRKSAHRRRAGVRRLARARCR